MTQYPSIRSIEQVVEADLSLGCGACHQVAPDKIQVPLNHTGYLSPVVTSDIPSTERVQTLASYLLTSGEEDAVLHICMSATDSLLSEYRISTTPSAVVANAGSRYAALLLGLRAEQHQHARAVFIAKPCDVAAMRKLATVGREVRRQVRYCLSFMCAWVASIKVTHAVLKAWKSQQEQMVQFRHCGNVWHSV